MTTSRDAFLERVRQAVSQGNRPGTKPPLEARGGIGYQGGGPDLVARFQEEFQAAGGHFHLASGEEAARAKVLELARSFAPQRVLLGRGDVIDSLNLHPPLAALGLEIVMADQLTNASARVALFAADLGITGVNRLVAETGSLIVTADPREPRSLSLLPPVHIAVARSGQLVPDLFDLFEANFGPQGKPLPSCLTVITGPSKTGDIELRLVTGVHGPGEVHLVLIKD